MTRKQLFEKIKSKRSYLCVGLDTDPDKIPAHLHQSPDAIWEFNKQIINATREYCVAYKPNTAFYEALGPAGWGIIQKTIDYIGPDHFIIADAKRGDIGNTSRLYARAFFEQLSCDAITVAPYMGEDSVKPFLEFPEKWVIILAHTSNSGAGDFQQLELKSNMPLYEAVVKKSIQWGSPDQLMLVVGATAPDKVAHIRTLAPDHFFLVPGVGAQGGDLEAITYAGINASCGLLVNASRAIIYADNGPDFAEAAAAVAENLRNQMDPLLSNHGL